MTSKDEALKMAIEEKEITFKAKVAIYPDLDLIETQNLHEAIIEAIADAIAKTAKGRILIGQNQLEIEDRPQ